MSVSYKRVPAIEKCFSILELMTQTKRPLGFTEIVRELDLNKSTVFNILHTLNDIDVVEKGPDGLFRLGTKLFTLGTAAAGGSELIQAVHPILETINNKFKLSCFLGILSGHEVIIVDKADHAQKIKISSEIGMRIPVFAGVAGKALISQFSEASIDDILMNNKITRYTSKTITDKTEYKKEILKVKKAGIAYDMEEYIEGLVAAAISVRTFRNDLHAAIWAVGLRQEFKGDAMKEISDFLFDAAEKINRRFSIMTGSSK